MRRWYGAKRRGFSAERRPGNSPSPLISRGGEAHCQGLEQMSEELRILMVEDDPNDATLIEHRLRSEKMRFVSRRVATKSELLAELKRASWDIILADYSLPQFNAFDVLDLLRREQQDIPLILVTGTLSEELAVSFIKQGGEDFILKSSLKRLPLAVVSALEKKQAESERKKAQQA